MKLSRWRRWQRASVALALAASVLGQGCGSEPTKPGAAATYIYKLGYGNIGGNEYIVKYSTSSTGNAEPAFKLTLPAGFYMYSMTTDAHGSIYVAGSTDTYNSEEVLVYADGADGSASPTRIITLTNGDYTATGIAVDGAGLLYIAMTGTPIPTSGLSPFVAIYSATASGAAPPLRTAFMPDDAPWSFNVDAAGNMYIITSPSNPPGSILPSLNYVQIYSPLSEGVAKPVRTIAISGDVLGVAADASGDVFVNIFLPNEASVISEYSTKDGTDRGPTRTINVSSNASSVGQSVRVDAAGNIFTELYLVNAAPTPAADSAYGVQVFSPDASGHATPMTSFVAVNADDTFLAIN